MEELKLFEDSVSGMAEWMRGPRFDGITRLYSARQVAQQQGTIDQDYTVARRAAEDFYARLRELFAATPDIVDIVVPPSGHATLIEALTYRMGPHTTTDDARRYRHDDDVAEWHPRDPLERVRRYLEAAGEWDAAWQSELEEAAAAAVEDAVATAEGMPPFTSDEIFAAIEDEPYRFIMLCDDLTFETGELAYKMLKSALDGSVYSAPENVLIYVTSNRRYLLPEYDGDHLGGKYVKGELQQSEIQEEKSSLSDRFGLWLGFHPCTQDEFLAMIRGYCDAFGIEIDDETLRAEAIEWQATRGARSGRVAWQYFTDLAGRRGVYI